MVRRRVAAGVGVVLLIVIILIVNGCLKGQKTQALKDYNHNVSLLAQESDERVSRPLFAALTNAASKSALSVEVQIDQLRIQAQNLASQAKKLSAPGDMAGAQRNLLLVFDMRAEGLTKVAALTPTALGGQGKQATNQIAGDMEIFLASDVIYSQRVAPLIQQALDDNDIHGQTVSGSKFLPSIGWLDPTQVGDRINPDADTSSPSSSGAVKPGTHGHGLVSVTAGDEDLQPGGQVNRVPARAPLPVQVTYANQGENDETNVTISVRVTSSGTKAITATKKLNQTKAGTQGVVPIQLTSVPPKGTSSTMTVKINAVRGEQKTDNNSQTYTILFN
jgi:hypothetical protein